MHTSLLPCFSNGSCKPMAHFHHYLCKGRFVWRKKAFFSAMGFSLSKPQEIVRWLQNVFWIDCIWSIALEKNDRYPRGSTVWKRFHYTCSKSILSVRVQKLCEYTAAIYLESMIPGMIRMVLFPGMTICHISAVHWAAGFMQNVPFMKERQEPKWTRQMENTRPGSAGRAL